MCSCFPLGEIIYGGCLGGVSNFNNGIYMSSSGPRESANVGGG